ncbi:MAG: hypothetical protein ACYTGV_00935 [Planctomycetota bacterium]|jgi:hypothetical protein
MTRLALLVLTCLSACSSTVKDLPLGRPVEEGKALIAARVAYGGTGIGPRLYLRPDRGNRLLVEPSHEAFVVALEPGRYTIEQFGLYLPAAGRVTFEAVAGRAHYIGDFRPYRDEMGNLRIVLSDGLDALREELRLRYGADTPALERSLAQSSLEPLGDPRKDVVIAMRPVDSRVTGTVTGSFSYGAGVARPYYIRRPYDHDDDPLDG